MQVIYIGLAILIGAGLILFGVGTGGGGGGLFGGLIGSNSNSNSANSAVNSATKGAIAKTKKHPQSPAAWSQLVAARYSAARTDGFDSTTSTFTPAGKAQLTLLTQAYERYSKLTSKPSANTAIYAARAYDQLGQWSKGSAAWQLVTQRDPTDLSGLECVAVTSSLAKDKRVAALAQNRLLSRLPKSVRKSDKATLTAAEKSGTDAKQLC